MEAAYHEACSDRDTLQKIVQEQEFRLKGLEDAVIAFSELNKNAQNFPVSVPVYPQYQVTSYLLFSFSSLFFCFVFVLFLFNNN